MSGLLVGFLPAGVPMAADSSQIPRAGRSVSRRRGRKSAMAQRIASDSHYTDVNKKAEHQDEPQTKPIQTKMSTRMSPVPPSCTPWEILVPPSCTPTEFMLEPPPWTPLPPSKKILAADEY
eukprot:gnl/TRDRNA2_/TRDRNA2_178951_c0_seq1.p1 gnl/TRDRNA2_/TRDRNA2_178951_c0~~gnl/TRDRNA2_/TRDRNA2_178951_c0_seq1.p1  ORF type:complete len:121 (+),score=10.96 gnl/TRDRNA2_/TRDRNA2_178951_c0_seq1:90-452(+)